MHVLVTGAGGFLGGLVARRLADAGRSVRGLDIAWPQAAPDGVEAHAVSILDPGGLARAMAGVDLVIHAAAEVRCRARDRRAHDRVNTLGTCRVLAAARRAGAHTVVVSDHRTLVARDCPRGRELDESIAVPPGRLIGRLARTKREAELFAASAAAAGQRVTIVLPGRLIGPDIGAFADMASAAAGRVPGGRINIVAAGAVAGAVIRAGERPGTGERFLLTGEDVDLRDAAAAAGNASAPGGRIGDWLARRRRQAPVVAPDDARLWTRAARFRAARAEDLLGFEGRGALDCLRAARDRLRPAPR